MKRMMKRHSQLIEKDGKYRGGEGEQRHESGSVVGEVERQQMKRKREGGKSERREESWSLVEGCLCGQM